MPSEADAVKEKSALFHKSKTNSTDSNKTAKISPTLRKILPDSQSVTYKDWRFPPTFILKEYILEGRVNAAWVLDCEEAVVLYLFPCLAFSLVKGLCCSPGRTCYKPSLYGLVTTSVFVCKSPSSALPISLHRS